MLKKLHGPVAAHGFILAGGTALAIQKGHRISFDLDFFSTGDFSNDRLISEINRITGDFELLAEGEGSLMMNIEGVKVSFIKYEYPFLDEMRQIQKTRVAGILDIAAMKVIAINQRGVKRDFVDLYVILQDVPFHKLASHMIKRFGKKRINPIQIGKSFIYFSDADTNPDPAYREGMELKWDDIRAFFRRHARQFVLDLEMAKKETMLS